MSQIIYYRTAKCASSSIIDGINQSEHRSIHLKPKTNLNKVKLDEYEIIIVGVACNPFTSCFLKMQAELDKLKNHKSFAVCRDPYSKFISSINYCISKGKLTSNKLLSFLSTQMDPNKDKNKELALFSDHDKLHILRTQTDALSINGHFFADEIIKYENLNTLPDFFKSNGMNITLPKKNITKKKPLQLNEQMIKFVEEKFSTDFKNFNYEIMHKRI